MIDFALFFIRPRLTSFKIGIASSTPRALRSAPLPSGPTMGTFARLIPGRSVASMTSLAEGRQQQLAQASGPRKKNTRLSKHGHGRLTVSARRLHQSFHVRATEKGCSCCRPQTVMDVNDQKYTLSVHRCSGRRCDIVSCTSGRILTVCTLRRWGLDFST